MISNDYDESHSAYKTGPGFWRYVPGANGDLELRLFEYRPGLLRNAVLTSALARYLVFNLQLGQRWLEFKSLMSSGIAMAETRHDASVSDDDRKRIQASIAAVDAFFRDLPLYAGLPRSRILFVVEGFRYSDLAVASREATSIGCGKPFLRGPPRLVTIPSISIRYSSSITAEPASGSSSRAMAIGPPPTMVQRPTP